MTKIGRIMLYKIAPAVPVVQLVLSLVSCLGFHLSYDLKNTLGNTVGYSLLTSIVYVVLFFFATKHKYCFIPQVCTCGLIVSNIISWMGSAVSYEEFADVYDVCIPLICFLTIVLIYTKKPHK